MTCPTGIAIDPRAIINVAVAITGCCSLFTLWTGHVTSSSWLSQIPSFRQETCHAYYRNDPVKYDLADERHCVGPF